ncbi:hypothetical protein IKG02_02280 [Candidatus Saccharibacteria bacterium]|nr:hypothetical protein [Candidatus Saccharibacteria bacterium]
MRKVPMLFTGCLIGMLLLLSICFAALTSSKQGVEEVEASTGTTKVASEVTEDASLKSGRLNGPAEGSRLASDVVEMQTTKAAPTATNTPTPIPKTTSNSGEKSASYSKFIDQGFVDQTSETAQVKYLQSKGVSKDGATKIVADFQETNKRIDGYYTVNLSEEQTRECEYFIYAPEEYGKTTFTSMDDLRVGAKGWVDALHFPLTVEYINVKDKNGTVLVNLMPWMEHFIPGFKADHELSPEEQKILLMGRIMTDPALAIAYAKSFYEIFLISGNSIGQLNEGWLSRLTNDHSSDTAEGSRGLEHFLLVRNSDGRIVTTPEFRSDAARLCILLNLTMFVEYTNDAPAWHYNLQYTNTDDCYRLPARQTTAETFQWLVLRSKTRKDGLTDFQIWVNTGDSRPGYPGYYPIPETRKKVATPTSAPVVVPTGNGDNPSTPTNNTPVVVPNPTTAPSYDTPSVNPNPTPSYDEPEIEPNPTPSYDEPEIEPNPTPVPEWTKDPSEIPTVDDAPDYGGQADISEVEPEERFQPTEPVSEPVIEDPVPTLPPPAIVNEEKDDCYVPGSEIREDLLPAPEAVEYESGQRSDGTPEPEIASQGENTEVFNEDDIPFFD